VVPVLVVNGKQVIGLDEPLYARHAVGALIVIAAILVGRSGARAHAPLEAAS